MERLHLHVQNVYKINLCNEGDHQASVHMPGVLKERILLLNFLSVLKSPNFLVDMAFAKEYHGKRRPLLFHDTLTKSCP